MPPPLGIGVCFRQHTVYLTRAMEEVILDNDRLEPGDVDTPTAFDAWLHSQLIHMPTVGDMQEYNKP
jgi:hypothetical protein